MQLLLRSFIMALSACLITRDIAANTYYVSTTGNDNNTGASWAAAYRTLRKALQVAGDGDQVWVAKGTYYPDEGPGATNNARTDSIRLKSNVALYGGFAGSETAIDQRNLALNKSIVSGEIQQDGQPYNNSQHIIVGEFISGFLLDGFDVVDARNNDPAGTWSGWGGGLALQGSNGTIRRVNFRQNVAFNGAGLLGYDGSSLDIESCIFENNYSELRGGGLQLEGGVTPSRVKNCLFVSNTAASGGAISVNSGASISNCTFYKNSFSAVHSYYLAVDISNSIFHKNINPLSTMVGLEIYPSINSVVADFTVPYATTNLISFGNPGFVDTTNGNFRLTNCSIAIDRGANLSLLETDLDGNPRVRGGQVDIGAYEYQANVNSTRFVNAAAVGANDGSSWQNAYPKLRDAIDNATFGCPAIREIWVATGTYYPDEGAGIINNDRGQSFSGRNFLSIYGGFSGTETSLSQRNLALNFPSKLSGEIQQDGLASNNSYKVVGNQNVDATFILDGFTIENGYATEGTAGSLTSSGAGVYLLNTQMIFRNCIIQNNTANYGAGAFCNGANVQFTNCLFRNNTTLVNSGTITHVNSSPIYTHCSMAGNTNPPGESYTMYNTNPSAPVIRNSIIWGGSSAVIGTAAQISYSIIQSPGIYAGTGNSNVNPRFADEAAGLLQLLPCSPGINTASAQFSPPTDLLGLPRNMLGAPDMGAYELEALPSSVRLYVKSNPPGSRNGNTWATAYSTLNDALAVAANCALVNETWVAAGSYYPDEGTGASVNSRDSYFSLLNGVALYGGFAGIENFLNQRNLSGPASILSGEIQQDADSTNNTDGIFRNSNVNATAVLDGFTIQLGASTNSGGAIINNNSSPTIRNCIFKANRAPSWGGAVYNNSSNPNFINCLFTHNTAAIGGVMFNASSSPVFTNCTFAANSAPQASAIWSQATSLAKLSNCIVWGNTGSAALAATGTSPFTVTYSLLQEPMAGAGNISANPLFVNTAAADYRLNSCSPAINTATATGAPTTDILGLARPASGGYDMGVYEKQLVYGQAIFVRDNAAGANNGISWANAFTGLQSALKVAAEDSCVKEVWVAAGTYKPTSNTDRTVSFALKNNLAVYGGFAGTETLLSQRNLTPAGNASVLSGDIGILNDRSDNTYHVFNNANIDSSAVLDGFTITAGNAADVGGAMYNSNSSPTIRNCIFRRNNAATWAGAVYCAAASNPQFINCVFTGNTAPTGAGFFNTGSSPVFVNCTMTGNISPQGSFAWSQTNSLSKLTNCIVWGNTGSAALVNTVTSPYTVNYSITQEAMAGTGNLLANPQLADTSDGNYSLLSCSPALNTGNNATLPAGTTLDIAGRPRVFAGTVDMGAYERQANAGQTLIFVDSTATGNGDGTGWPHAFTKMLPALNEMNNCNSAVSLSMAKGTYVVPVFLINRLGVEIWGGYPSGGGTRNPILNPTIWKGSVQVLKSAKIDGVKLVQ